MQALGCTVYVLAGALSVHCACAMQTRGYRDSNESDYCDSDSKQLS